MPLEPRRRVRLPRNMSYREPAERCEEDGKVCLSKADAKSRAKWLMKKGRRVNDVLRVYHCPTCNWWHIAKVKKIKDRNSYKKTTGRKRKFWGKKLSTER